MAITLFLNLVGCKKENGSIGPSPTVNVEKYKGEFRLIRNGEPFYIKGGAAHPDYLQELKEAGANTARIYDTINLNETLDEARELGLAVVVDIPMPKFINDPYFYEDDKYFIPLKKRVERVVQQHKNHPALLYWNLGNEIYYPYFYTNTKFFKNYNILIDLIHNVDPNHPISTVTIGANKLRVLSIHRKSPQLDFVSFNSFGVLSQFSGKLKPIKPIWSGPHVITEWGVNGPWEVQLTQWNAPIEETSTKKAEQINERYHNYLAPLKEENSFGSFIFYWGKKNEVTPTWYSLFGNNKLKTQGVFEMEKIWKNHNMNYSGPKLEYILLNGRGAGESIVLPPSTDAEVEVVNPKSQNGPLKFSAEVRMESWNDYGESILNQGSNSRFQGNRITFTTPEKEGPYRIFIYLTDGSEYYATANIPFYVLNPENGEK